jgi:hypothetical protein
MYTSAVVFNVATRQDEMLADASARLLQFIKESYPYDYPRIIAAIDRFDKPGMPR